MSGFAERARVAIANQRLRASLARLRKNYSVDRRVSLREFNGDWEEYRNRARRIRERTFARLDHYVATFADNCQARGGQVHFAADGDEACRIVIDIARARDAKRAVKMKSMFTEEIHLREALGDAGIRALETDLGEWILQLAKETPSHLIMPAVHKLRAEVKELFDDKLGPDASEHAEALVARARRVLRPEFLAADVGITGCNFAAADTGTIILVSNEGNGRLCTSAPRVHIALIPVEKLVPTLDEAVTLLKVLPGSATGQKITAYVNWVTGPRRAGELDGPEELHVVFVDNGRSAALGTEYEEALCCIRCGACLNVCPVYGRVGGHTYGSVYPGPIGIALTPVTAGPSKTADELAHASSLCGACEEICPVHIDIPRMILASRKKAVAAERNSGWERALFRIVALVLASPLLYRMALWFGRKIPPRLLERFARPWTESRQLPPLAAQSFRDKFAAHRRRREARPKVGDGS